MDSSKAAISAATRALIVFGALFTFTLVIVAALTAPRPVLHEQVPSAPPPPPPPLSYQPPPDPLPEVCRPWVEPPPSHRVRPSELHFSLPDGERPDGLDCWSNGICNFKAYENAHGYAMENLFARTETGHRAPHGGSVNCEKPLTADWVTCRVNVTNVTFDVVEVVDLACPGTWMCERGSCCRVTSRRKTFIPDVPPSQADMDKVEEEMRQNREKRYRTCRPYCLHPKFKDQCSKYWNQI
jgi:hypothetical protein